MTTKTTQSHEQMLARIEAESNAGQSEQKQLMQLLTALQGELTTLDARAQSRATQQRIAEETLAERKQTYEQASFLNTLSMGTLRQTTDTKTLEKASKEAEQHLARLLAQIERETAQDEKRRAVLLAELQLTSDRLSTLRSQEDALETARTQIHAEQGEARLSGFQQRLNELQHTKQTLLQSLESVDEAIATLDQEAVPALGDWPEQQQAFITALPYEDETTWILQAELAFITLLLEEGPQIADISTYDLERAGAGRFQSLDSVLSIDVATLSPVLHRYAGREPDILQKKQHDVRNLLSYYVERQKGQRA